jgi:hypothetical protein
MGTVSTDRIIEAPMTIENGGEAGVFGLVSRDPTQTIFVTMKGRAHSEIIEVVNPGDSCSFNLLDIQQVVIEVATYPSRALINFTNAAIVLGAAPFASSSVGLLHFDATVNGAANTTIWTPTAGMRFVIDSLVMSTDTQNRVALIDGTSDVAGKRIAAPYLAANGGMVYGPYASQAPDNPLVLVTLSGGLVFLAVDGRESS